MGTAEGVYPKQFEDIQYSSEANKFNSDALINNDKISYTDAAAVGLNTTHRGSDGKDHSDVVTNNAKVTYDDQVAVGNNTTHRGSDGKDHSDVVTNNSKVSYTDGADVTLNTAARVGADNGLYKHSNETYTDDDTSQTFTDAFVTTDSLVIVSITGSDPQGTWSVVSNNGSFTISSTVAESVDITFDYFVQKN